MTMLQDCSNFLTTYENQNRFSFTWKIKNFFSCPILGGELASPMFKLCSRSKFYLKLSCSREDNLVCDVIRSSDDEGPDADTFKLNLSVMLENIPMVTTYVRSAKKSDVIPTGFSIPHRLLIIRMIKCDANGLLIIRCTLDGILYPRDSYLLGCIAETNFSTERFISYFSVPFANLLGLRASNISNENYTVKVPVPNHSQRSGGKEFEIELSFRNISQRSTCVTVIIRRLLFNERNAAFTCFLLSMPDIQEVDWFAQGENTFQPNERDWVSQYHLDPNQLSIYRFNRNIRFKLEFTHFTGERRTIRESIHYIHQKLVKYICKRLFPSVHEERCYDAVLKIGECTYMVHRNVLSARSPVFKSMFESEKAPQFTFEIDNLDEEVLNKLLSIIYKGMIEISNFDSAFQLCDAAMKYSIPEIKAECSEFLVANMRINNVVDVLRLAEKYEDQDLIATCQFFIFSNIHDVLVSDEWISLMREKINFTRQLMLSMCKKLDEYLNA